MKESKSILFTVLIHLLYMTVHTDVHMYYMFEMFFFHLFLIVGWILWFDSTSSYSCSLYGVYWKPWQWLSTFSVSVHYSQPCLLSLTFFSSTELPFNSSTSSHHLYLYVFVFINVVLISLELIQVENVIYHISRDFQCHDLPLIWIGKYIINVTCFPQYLSQSTHVLKRVDDTFE